MVVKISDHVKQREAEPEFFYTAAMHGDELTGFPLMLKLIDELLSNYGKDPEITQLVNSTEIYINPLANPDGAYGAINSMTSDFTNDAKRENAHGIDLNRNFPDDVKGFHHTANGLEPETKAFMEFHNAHHFVLAANLHSGEEVTNYPWDNKPISEPHPDHQYFETICQDYAYMAQQHGPQNYFSFDPDVQQHKSKGVTHGSSWYLVHGSRQDYINFYGRTKEITIELSKVKTPKASELEAYWNYNRQALLNLIKEAHYGLRGQIRNAQGQALKAKVSILNHDKAYSWTRSHKTFGTYQRLLAEGHYLVSYEAPGYLTKVLSVDIKKQQATIQDVVLDPIPIIKPSVFTSYNTLIEHFNGPQPLETFEGALTALNHPALQPDNVGADDFSCQGLFTNSSNYLSFHSKQSIQLKSVTIHARTTGSFEIQLLDKDAKLIESKIIVVNTKGIQPVALDFMIPEGRDMRLKLHSSSNGLELYSSTKVSEYPYSNDIVTIIGSDKGTQYYPYFFDWQFEAYQNSDPINTIDRLIPYSNISHLFNHKKRPEDHPVVSTEKGSESQGNTK